MSLKKYASVMTRNKWISHNHAHPEEYAGVPEIVLHEDLILINILFEMSAAMRFYKHRDYIAEATV
jgi:hypothetical protein